MLTLQYLKKKFCPQKIEKTPLKVAQKIHFFPYCPELPNWPKQKNSCSKLWLIDQMYIKLGISLLLWAWVPRFRGQDTVDVCLHQTQYQFSQFIGNNSKIHKWKKSCYRLSKLLVQFNRLDIDLYFCHISHKMTSPFCWLFIDLRRFTKIVVFYDVWIFPPWIQLKCFEFETIYVKTSKKMSNPTKIQFSYFGWIGEIMNWTENY